MRGEGRGTLNLIGLRSEHCLGQVGCEGGGEGDTHKR